MPLYRALRHVTHGNAAGSHVCPPGTLIELPEGEAGDCFELVEQPKPAKAPEPVADEPKHESKKSKADARADK